MTFTTQTLVHNDLAQLEEGEGSLKETAVPLAAAYAPIMTELLVPARSTDDSLASGAATMSEIARRGKVKRLATSARMSTASARAGGLGRVGRVVDERVVGGASRAGGVLACACEESGARGKRHSVTRSLRSDTEVLGVAGKAAVRTLARAASALQAVGAYAMARATVRELVDVDRRPVLAMAGRAQGLQGLDVRRVAGRPMAAHGVRP